MNVAIVGYGRMGRMVESVASNFPDVSVVSRIDPVAIDADYKTLSPESLEKADVAIDFSSADVGFDNARYYSTNDIPAVIGTTGWYESVESVEERLSGRGRLLISGNFSIGIALFLKLVECSGRLFDKFPIYDVAVQETHHRLKKDAPSGTAMMIAEKLVDEIDRKKEATDSTSPSEDQLEVSSIRLGSVVGMHSVLFDSPFDSITLTHDAKDRSAFARGALESAIWLLKQEDGIYSFQNYMDSLFQEGLR